MLCGGALLGSVSATAEEPDLAAPTPAKFEAGYLSPEAALRQSWSNIKPEMADFEFAELLGEPAKKFKLDGRDVWYYFYPGTGRVEMA